MGQEARDANRVVLARTRSNASAGGTKDSSRDEAEMPPLRPGTKVLLLLLVWGLIATAGTWLWVTYRPGYTAIARVRVDSLNPQMPYTLQEPPLPPEIVERNLADQAVLAKSDEVLLEAIGDSGVQNTSWYKDYPKDRREMMILDLQDQLNVVPIKGTGYFAVAMTCRSPDDPHIIVNSAVQKYLFLVDRLYRRRYNEQLAKYKDERDALAKQIDRAREAKATFIATQLGAAPGVTQGLNVVAEALRTLTTEAARLEAEKLQSKARYDSLVAQEPAPRSVPATVRTAIEQDPRIVRLREEQRSLQLTLEAGALASEGVVRSPSATQPSASTAGKPASPDRAAAQARLKTVESSLVEVLAEREQEYRDEQLESAEMGYLSATEADLQLQERLMELREQQRDLDRMIAQLQRYEEDEARLEKNYEMVADYTRMLETILNQQSVVRIELAGNAVRPVERSTPRWDLNMAVGWLPMVVYGILLFAFRRVRRMCAKA